MEKHLDESEVAQYVDFLRLGSEIPSDEIVEHVRLCFTCKEEIMESCDMIDELQKEEQS